MSADEFNLGPFERDERQDPDRRWFRKLAQGNGANASEDGDYSESLKPIIEERQELADIGQLGGKSTSNRDGGIVKKTLLAVCDCCWLPLDGPPAICPIDKKKVHPKCLTKIDQRVMCKDCLMASKPLSKSSYKIMMLMLFNLEDRRLIQRLTRMLRDDMEISFLSLLETGYITRRGSSSIFDITDRGLNVWIAYRPVYGADEDVVALEKELRAAVGVL